MCRAALLWYLQEVDEFPPNMWGVGGTQGEFRTHSLARAYCAYAIHPSELMTPDMDDEAYVS